MAERLYVEEKMSTCKIAEQLGVSNSVVLDYLRRRGVETRTRREALIVRWHASIEEYRAFVQQAAQMNRRGLSQQAICEELDVCERTVARALQSKYNPFRGDERDDDEMPWWAKEKHINSFSRQSEGLRPQSMPTFDQRSAA